MFGSVIFDVAIGLVFVFVFVSLIASSVAEGIEGILKTRAMDLEKGIREILNDPKGEKTKELFAHPLIHSLFIGEYDPSRIKQDVEVPWKAPQSHMRWLSRRSLPSYIPGKNFAEALLDIIARGPLGQPNPADPAAPDPAAALDLEKWREAVKKIGNEKLERAVLNALDYSGGELEKAKANLVTWFDASMDRVSGWYKRRVQMILFAIGLVVAIVLNIDALTTATRLMNDRALRDAIVALASTSVTKVAEDESESPEETAAGEVAPPAGTPPTAEGTPPAGTPPAAEGTPPAETPVDGEPPVAERMPAIDIEEVKEQLGGLGFPMGWKSGVPGPQFAECFESDTEVDCKGRGAAIWVRTLIGWLITAFAVMFGAPFWFDLLGKIVSLRAAGNPPVEQGKKAKK